MQGNAGKIEFFIIYIYIVSYDKDMQNVFKLLLIILQISNLQCTMASVDAGQYSLSSDEKLSTFECSPCQDDGVVREATYYCPECSEYFCSSCESSLHRRLKATKAHKILPANEITKDVVKKHVKIQIMACACSRDNEIEFICDEHKCLICSECKIVNHRKCKTCVITEKCKSFDRKIVMTLLKRTKGLEEEANQLCAEHTEHLQAFEASKVKCREDIKRFRDEMVQFIETLAMKTNNDLDNISLNNAGELTTNLLACKGVMEKLKHDQTLLEGVLSSDDLQQMLIADFVLKDKLKNYESVLREVTKEIKSVSVEFQADTTITDIFKNADKLGNIVMKGRGTTDGDFPDNLLLLSPVKSTRLDVTPKGASRMTGSAFLPNKELAICDCNAKRLILLDQAFKGKSEIELSASPWDVAFINETDLVVTLPLSQQLQFITFTPTLSLGSSISVGKNCYDVETVGKDMCVLCTNDPGEGEVRIIDIDGNVKKRLGVNTDGAFLMHYPLHMSISHDQNKVFVSDFSTHTVYCLSLKGDILYQIKNKNVQRLRGVLLDKQDNLLLCSGDNLYKVEAKTNNCTKFLSSEDGLADTYCLSYRQSDNTLVVTCCNKLLVYKIK